MATPTITVPATASAGDTVSVIVTNGPGDPHDWVAWYCPATGLNTPYTDWKYLNDTKSAPAIGLTNATVHFTVPAGAATCQARWFASDSFTRLGTSDPVPVAPPPPPSISLTAPVSPGAPLVVAVANGPGSRTDWVALYCPATAPDGALRDYKYM